MRSDSRISYLSSAWQVISLTRPVRRSLTFIWILLRRSDFQAFQWITVVIRLW